MKLSIAQSDLIGPLQAVARSCGIRSSLPVLANILLQTSEGRLKLSATNLELGIVKTVNAQIQEEGEVTVPSKTFLELISSLVGATIEIESREDQIKVTSNNFNALLNGISATEFPTIPLASDEGVSIEAEAFKKSLPEISFAAAVDEGRPVLTGILTEIKKNTLELIATDGFRLAHKTALLNEPIDKPFKALIPKKTMEEVGRIISEELSNEKNEKIGIGTSDNQNQIIFRIGQCQLSSRLIEGTFPDWEKIVPKASTENGTFLNRTIIDRAELLKAVKLASIFAKDAANIVTLEANTGKIKLISKTKELGSQETELDAQVEGEMITVALNARFLIDTLSACPSSQISIEFTGNLTPVLIKPIGETELEYVVMPIRV